MRKLFFYVLRQILAPFLLFALLLTLVVWMTQSLRLLDLVINRGQSAVIFAYLTMLMLPSLLVVIIPIAFFGAALFALNKLNSDSELVVMWAAGISRVQMAAPVLFAAAVAMAIPYLCSLYLMPLGQCVMKAKVFDIRADIGAAILREGTFTTPSEGLTVFIRELSPSGEIKGILVHDNREAARPVTYLAETGVLAQTREGARLIMLNGNIERSEEGGQRLSLLKFDRYVFDLDEYASTQRSTDRETSERFWGELLDPQFTGPNQEVRRGVYLAEAHNRLAGPLYCIAFVLMVFAALVALALSLDLADQFTRTTERGIPPDIILSMSLLKLPDIAQKLLPFAVLLGAIFAFARMSRNHELVATRAAGISAWQFLTPSLLVAVGLGVLTMTLFSPVAAAFLSQYTRLEARYVHGQASQLAVSSTGLWLRQGDASHQSVVHALRVADQGVHLEEVIVFLYQGLDHYAGRIDASSADL